MDPISVDALTALMVKAAAGEAGKSAWNGLLALVRRVFNRSRPAREALEALEQAQSGDHAAAAQVAQHLVAQSLADPALAEALQAWMDDTQAHAGSVANIISGEARIHGNVVQARDIGGPITFQ